MNHFIPFFHLYFPLFYCFLLKSIILRQMTAYQIVLFNKKSPFASRNQQKDDESRYHLFLEVKTSLTLLQKKQVFKLTIERIETAYLSTIYPSRPSSSSLTQFLSPNGTSLKSMRKLLFFATDDYLSCLVLYMRIFSLSTTKPIFFLIF